MMNKSEWKKVKLEECADINMGQSPISSSYNIDGNGIPFYQGNADFGELYPKLRYYCSKPIKVANEEDLLLSVRAPIGKINIAKTSCCIGRGLCAITPKKDIVLQKYLYYILKYKENEFNLKGTGSTFKAINKKQISETMFLLPDINIQKNIILKLENSEKLLKLKKEQLSELEKLVKFQFLKMFGDPINNLYNFQKCKIKDIALKKLMYGSGSSAVEFDNKIRYIRITDIDNLGNLKTEKVSPSLFEEKYLLSEGDILFARSGATVGKTFYFKKNYGKCIFAGYLIRLTPNQLKVLPEYLFYFTKTDFYNNFIKANSKTVAQPNINAQQYENLEILIPPIELQNKFAEFVRQVDKSKVELQKSIDETQLLFDSLMDKYFG